MDRMAWLLVGSVSIACGPETTTNTGGDTGAGGSSSGASTTATSASASSTTGSGSSSSGGEGSSGSTGGADTGSSTGEPQSCFPGDQCPPGQCCAQDVPGIFICVDFGGQCNCQTDRDCTDGLLCRAVSIKGELACVQCGDDSDCDPGWQCEFREQTCVPIPDGSSSGSGGGSSSGA